MTKPYPNKLWMVRLFVFQICFSSFLLPKSLTGACLESIERKESGETTARIPDFPPVRVEYDPIREVYLLYLTGETFSMLNSVPRLLTKEEYLRYRFREYQRYYFRERNRAILFPDSAAGKTFYSPLPKRRKPANLFGEGGFKYQLKGTAAISAGLKSTYSGNPSLAVRSRRQLYPELEEKIRLDLTGGIGTKLEVDLKYDTESPDGVGIKEFKIKYQGDEDEFIRLIEAGKVNMNFRNSLFSTGADMLGVKAGFQFGKLHVNALAAQQETVRQPVHSKRGNQKREFEISIDQYDENQHFFLSHYFYNLYDIALANLPHVASGIRINRMEVWMTNKERDFGNARDVVAFADLAEPEYIFNPQFYSLSRESVSIPFNHANNLYDYLLTGSPDKRRTRELYQFLNQTFDEGKEYERIENARLLDSSEYTFHEKLGYISLVRPLLPDETLAVAFEYSFRGKNYQVGELSTDHIGDSESCLFVKLLKSRGMTPEVPVWRLMMKNIYSIPVRTIQKDNFRMEIFCRNDSSGIWTPYLPEQGEQEGSLLRLMQLDRLDTYLNERPDGVFDFVEGYTVLPGRGKIIFPVTEPFAKLPEKYMFEELYDSTLVYVRQIPGKNRFVLRGECRGEYLDNQMPDIDSRTAHTLWGKQRNTVLGLELEYDITPVFSTGFSVLHHSEHVRDEKRRVAEEPVKNTLWGTHFRYRQESKKLPIYFSIKGESAYLAAGRIKNKEYGEYAYLDDFESAKTVYDLSNPYMWHLSSTPYQDKTPLFPEASLINDINYGKNRALLAWYRIDGIFNFPERSDMPVHLKRDREQLSNHYVRGITPKEIFPDRELHSSEKVFLPVLNIAFYPQERGPYNLDADGISPEGNLSNPAGRWGGIMRKLEWTNFETSNVDYIEFWLLDPFLYNKEQAKGGDLYLNLGEVSEDILKDGRKFFENGLPIDGDLSRTETTVWGKVPRQQATVYAFENSPHARRLQDVGLNGLSSAEEKEFQAYNEYLRKISRKVSGQTLAKWEHDPFSPLHDPAGDNYHHFRGADYDRDEVDILSRYKRYNGTEGNSGMKEDSPYGYDISAKAQPDMEDIDGDNMLNETERYFEYKISIRPADMQVGKNYITDIRTSTVILPNGRQEIVSWYQFKIPVKNYTGRIGNIRDFSFIRFIRLYMTGWDEQAVLRLASLGLVKGEWRIYEQSNVEISTVSIEENSNRTPVNYVLPPGVTRVEDKTHSQHIRQNEQSLSLKVREVPGDETCAVYKSVIHDLRNYKNLQLFVHAEGFPDDISLLRNGELSIFLRIGNDYTNNYYEYEVPLSITPPGHYSSFIRDDQEKVWPVENKLNVHLPSFTELKRMRNKIREQSSAMKQGYGLLEFADPAYPQNRIKLCGNPSLSDIQVVMIGIKNHTSEYKNAEIWINELRLTGYENRNGWAVAGGIETGFADLGTLYAGGRFESSGFGDPSRSSAHRRMENYTCYETSASLQLGKLLPSSWQAYIPFNYSWSKEKSVPLYNPYEPDILLSESLPEISLQERDSLKQMVLDKTLSKNISFDGVRFGKISSVSKPYDPANFIFNYSYSEIRHHNPDILYENTRNHQASLLYNYTPPTRIWYPLRNFSRLAFFYYPTSIAFSTFFDRRYSEVESRSFSSSLSSLPVSFRQHFSWNRSFTLQWLLTRHLQTSFQSGTQARIEEPYMQVNKKLNPDRYQVWKDSVFQSLLHLGQPLLYDQNCKVVYNLPFSFIPGMNWMQGVCEYQSFYNWQRRGAHKNMNTIGNLIRNQRILKYQGLVNLYSLYNKNKYLRKESQINFLRRLLTSVQRLAIVYEKIEGMEIAGFLPEPGDLFGQKRSGGKWVPGLSFAFGGVDKSYIDNSIKKGWLLIDTENVEPAVIRHSTKWALQGTLEPLAGLRIELSTDRLNTRNTRIEYQYPDMPSYIGGSFISSTVAIRSFFKPTGSSADNYFSSVFDRFRENRQIVSMRLEEEYKQLSYPDKGFLVGSSYAGKSYIPGDPEMQQSDVLIPAFLAAYQGKEPRRMPLSALSPGNMLFPNWRITYDKLNEFPFIRNYFREFILSHQYRGMYNVQSFSSYLNWAEAGKDKGFLPPHTSGSLPLPSSPYQISAVSLSDGFTPLVGVDARLYNRVEFNTAYNTSRNLSLSMVSARLTENHFREYLVGIGYATDKLHTLLSGLFRKKSDNEFRVKIDFAYRKNFSILRKIEDGYSQLLFGNTSKRVHFITDYRVSRLVTLRLYFDLEKDIPLLSETDHLSTVTSGGVTLLFSFD